MVPVDFAQFWDAEEAKVGDDHFAIFQKDVLRFQVLVNDTSGVQVPHSLNQLQINFMLIISLSNFRQ